MTPEPSREPDDRTPATTRRDFVALAGAIASAAAAGCQDGSDPGTAGPEPGDGSEQPGGGSERVERLLSELDVEEKVEQLLQFPVTLYTEGEPWERGSLSESALADLADAGVGSVLSDGGSAPVPNTPAGWAEATDRLQEAVVEESEPAVPLLYGTDAVHGHNNLEAATIFPHNLGLGATWDPNLARRIGEHVATVLRATGVHWNFDPVADVARDHRWGRYYECYGEDPLLTAAMVRETVLGLQGGTDGVGSGDVAATPKHFVGYSRPRAGRDRNPAEISRRRLLTTHLVPFVAAVEAGAETVMLNSGSVNGIPAHAASELVDDVLREDLGFDGVVLTDWADVQKLHTEHGLGESLGDAVRMALDAGVDVSMTGLRAPETWDAFRQLATAGEIPEDRLDQSLRRVLALKERLGLFDDPYADPDAAADRVGEARDLAREAARKSLTLLENDGVLPLADGTDVLVTGPAADDVAMQLGGWTVGWQGVPDDRPAPPAVTGSEGVAAAAPDGASIEHVPWSGDDDTADAVDAASAADVAVCFLGEQPYAEGEGDDQRAALSAAQASLATALAETGTQVVAVLFAGRPLSLAAAEEACSAVLMGYLPGTAGGTAVGDVLFGDAEPGGRLPVTWPEHGGQAPLFHDRLPAESLAEPAYEFGAGRSYGSIVYDVPAVTPSTVEDPALDATVELAIEAVNGSRRPAEDVAIALGRPSTTAGRHQQSARAVLGFERLRVPPGEQRRVVLECSLAPLAVVDGGTWSAGSRRIPPGEYEIGVADRVATLEVA